MRESMCQLLVLKWSKVRHTNLYEGKFIFSVHSEFFSLSLYRYWTWWRASNKFQGMTSYSTLPKHWAVYLFNEWPRVLFQNGNLNRQSAGLHGGEWTNRCRIWWPCCLRAIRFWYGINLKRLLWGGLYQGVQTMLCSTDTAILKGSALHTMHLLAELVFWWYNPSFSSSTVCWTYRISLLQDCWATCKGKFNDPPSRSCSKNINKFYQVQLSKLYLCMVSAPCAMQ